MLLLVNEGSLLLSVGTPQDKHHTGQVVVDPVDHCICQILPTLKEVTLDGENLASVRDNSKMYEEASLPEHSIDEVFRLPN